MERRPMSFHFQVSVGLFLALAYIRSGVGLAKSSSFNPQREQPSVDAIRHRVSFLIRRTIEKSKTKLSNNEYAIVMPVLPSEQDLHEVRGYGDQAVRILAGYATSTSSMEQHVSLRFLGQFQDELALEAVQGFAEKSAFPGIRQQGTVMLRGFPAKKAKPIVERISKADPDPDVRAHARHVLDGFPSDQ